MQTIQEVVNVEVEVVTKWVIMATIDHLELLIKGMETGSI
jgi:hypothetical protein